MRLIREPLNAVIVATKQHIKGMQRRFEIQSQESKICRAALETNWRHLARLGLGRC